jgi:hypothetical protein
LDDAVKVLISRAQGPKMLKGLFVVDVEISLVSMPWSVHAPTKTSRRDSRRRGYIEGQPQQTPDAAQLARHLDILLPRIPKLRGLLPPDEMFKPGRHPVLAIEAETRAEVDDDAGNAPPQLRRDNCL